jgi:hypothetical protein
MRAGELDLEVAGGVGADEPLAVEFGADPAGQRVGVDVAEVTLLAER